MGARLRSWWAGATFGAAHPGRRVAALAVLGTITGAGEALVVLLLVALVAGGESRLPGLIGPAETWTLAGFALLSTVVLAASHFAAAWTSARAATDAQRRVQGLLIDAFLAAPYADQRGARTGELQELVMGRARMVALGTAEAARAISTTANLLIVVVAAILVDVRATVVLLVAVAFAVAIARPFQARTRRMARESVQAYGTLATGVTETASLAPELRVFDATDPARERVGRNLDAARRLTEAVQLATTATPQLTRDATIAVLVVGMAVLVSSADVPIAVLGAAIVLVLRALAHAQALVGSLQRLADRAANLQPVLDRLAQWRPAAAAGTRPCPRVGTVELQGVTFTHRPGDPDALRDVDLRLEAGELCGIVGPTGAGKSTLAGIVLGLLAPDGGRVLVDGVPLGELAPHEWYRHTAWVGQDPRLLTGTVRENIRFLRPGVDDEAVERAARAAALEPDLAGWPEGLDHPVGSAGASLSGGQRQRVALARALVGRPSLVVLDEPTSALDAHAEAAVRDALAALRGHATVVVIAHRISTIRSCDRLVVLRGGRLVTAGPPDVVAREDPYVADVLALAAGDRPR